MPREWDVPTYADVADVPRWMPQRCPCCRRRVRADTLRDMRAVPGWVWDYACDGCVTQAERRGQLDRGDTLRRQGAPASVVAGILAKGRRG